MCMYKFIFDNLQHASYTWFQLDEIMNRVYVRNLFFAIPKDAIRWQLQADGLHHGLKNVTVMRRGSSLYATFASAYIEYQTIEQAEQCVAAWNNANIPYMGPYQLNACIATDPFMGTAKGTPPHKPCGIPLGVNPGVPLVVMNAGLLAASPVSAAAPPPPSVVPLLAMTPPLVAACQVAPPPTPLPPPPSSPIPPPPLPHHHHQHLHKLHRMCHLQVIWFRD